MTTFTEIQPEELEKSPFQLIGKDWMLITAKKDQQINTMTASWGGFGVMWAKNVVYIVIRPQRYTKEFIDHSDRFSLSFFDDRFRKTLNYLGTMSGREEDKIKKANLTVIEDNDTPYFAESHLAIFCQKLFAQDYQPENFLTPEITTKWYPEADYHTLYIAAITKILIKV